MYFICQVVTPLHIRVQMTYTTTDDLVFGMRFYYYYYYDDYRRT